ncbi:MAG TPA: hypothetical protein VIO38_09610 [Rariglobus sp.]
MTLPDDEGRRVAHAYLERDRDRLLAEVARVSAENALLRDENDHMLAENAAQRGFITRLLLDAAPRHGSLAAAQVYYGLDPQPARNATHAPAGEPGRSEPSESHTAVTQALRSPHTQPEVRP